MNILFFYFCYRCHFRSLHLRLFRWIRVTISISQHIFYIFLLRYLLIPFMHLKMRSISKIQWNEENTYFHHSTMNFCIIRFVYVSFCIRFFFVRKIWVAIKDHITLILTELQVSSLAYTMSDPRQLYCAVCAVFAQCLNVSCHIRQSFC